MSIDVENDDLQTALRKLKVREEVLKEFSTLSGLGNWEVDLITHQTQWSDLLYEIYRIDKNTPLSLGLFLDTLLLPEYKAKAQQIIQESLTSPEIFSFNAKVRRGDGKIIDVIINGKTLFDAQNKPLKLIGSTQDITAILSLQQEAKELSSLVEESSNEIYVVNYDTLDYLYVNKGAEKALGYTKNDLLQMNVRDINPHLKESEIQRLKNLLEKEQQILNKTVHQRRDGTLYYVQSFIHILQYKGEKAYVIFDTDISEIFDLESKYKKQAMILENIHDSVISLDNCGVITTWNQGSTKLFGYTAEEMLGKSIKLLYSPNNEKTLSECFESINNEQNLNRELELLKKGGIPLICDVSMSLSKDEFGNIDGYIGYIQDITKEKETQKMLEMQTKMLKHQAHHDTLTGLPNRTLFHDRLEQNISFCKRNNKKFALLFIDLDQFKNINDSLGHQIGDEVLIECAKRLKNVLREEDTLSRLGGDEFTIILREINSAQSAAKVAQKILDALTSPIIIQNMELYISSSIGISIYPDDTTAQEHLIKYADAAMYKAKNEGRNNYQFYSPEMTESAFERIVMEQNLRSAIKEKDFIVYYQAQVNAQNEQVVGMEALVRWFHPKLGMISPAKFIHIAEETGMIIELDLIVMRQALLDFKRWMQEGLRPGKLSLNLSAKQIDNKEFVTILKHTMEELEFEPQWLTLEITESQVMKDPEHSIKKLEELSQLGIELAIDDFGTGYSSLAYLKRLPVNKLKIDRAFVEGLPEDEEDIAISRAIIALANILKLKLVAEGVETKEQKDFMLQNGCHIIQGYYYAKPVNAQDMQLFLEKNYSAEG